MRYEALEQMARDLIGDGQSEALYFVTLQGDVVGVTCDFEAAWDQWNRLSQRSPRVECALEDRRTGVLASVEPVEDGSSQLIRFA